MNYQKPNCGDNACLTLNKVDESTYSKNFLLKNNNSSNPKSILGWCDVRNVEVTYTSPSGVPQSIKSEVSSDAHNWDEEINAVLAGTHSPVEFTVRTIINDIPAADINKDVTLSYKADVRFPVSGNDGTFTEATQTLKWDMKYTLSANAPKKWYHKLRWGYMVVAELALLTFATSFMDDEEEEELVQNEAVA